MTGAGSPPDDSAVSAVWHVDRRSVPGRDLVVCGDVGSTCTKVAVVDVGAGELVASAEHPTTVGTDVLDGLDAVLGRLAGECPDADLSPVRVCSSAGGGLRLAVVGYEALVTAEAGHRVGLSAGAKVVHVHAGRLDDASAAELLRARPDVLLLVGGADGGDREVLTHNAVRVGASEWAAPVVVAGNVDAWPDAAAALDGKTVLRADNVLPRIGELAPASARSAIREVFLSHVIGGKGLSRGSRFTQLVRCATPEAVLTAVELLADVPWRGSEPHGSEPRQVAAVDVGGATTDVYSVLTPDPERAGPRAPAAGTLWRSRTVEGDLGTRQSAPGVVQAAASEGLLRPGEQARLRAAAAAAAAPVAAGRPVPASPADQRLAELAMVVALRRHARGERVGGPDTPRLGGKDLRGVDLLIGSGGALRHSTSGVRALAAAARDHAGGWPLPERAVHTIDIRYVLAAAGLLAGDHRGAASRLLTDAFLVPK